MLINSQPFIPFHHEGRGKGEAAFRKNDWPLSVVIIWRARASSAAEISAIFKPRIIKSVAFMPCHEEEQPYSSPLHMPGSTWQFEKLKILPIRYAPHMNLYKRISLVLHSPINGCFDQAMASALFVFPCSFMSKPYIHKECRYQVGKNSI